MRDARRATEPEGGQATGGFGGTPTVEKSLSKRPPDQGRGAYAIYHRDASGKWGVTGMIGYASSGGALARPHPQHRCGTKRVRECQDALRREAIETRKEVETAFTFGLLREKERAAFDGDVVAIEQGISTTRRFREKSAALRASGRTRLSASGAVLKARSGGTMRTMPASPVSWTAAMC